jgi:agmatinase
VNLDPVEEPGGEGLYGLGTELEEAGVVIVPVPFEATVSYRAGAARGPLAILEASDQIDLFDLETERPYEAGLMMLEPDPQVAAWSREARVHAERVIKAGGLEADARLADDAAAVDAAGERLNAWVAQTVEPLLEAGKLVGVVGGDHSVPYASIEAHLRRWPELGILHVDAHADLRKSYEGFRWSHASILYNLRERLPIQRVVGVGYRDLAGSEHALLEQDPRFDPFYDPWLRRHLQEGTPWVEVAGEIVSCLPQQVYVTFDIDGLDPALCPHTGTPVPGGLSWHEATGLLRTLVESGREIVGFDLCEVGAPETAEDDWDANVGARLLYKLIGFALRSRSAPRAHSRR